MIWIAAISARGVERRLDVAWTQEQNVFTNGCEIEEGVRLHLYIDLAEPQCIWPSQLLRRSQVLALQQVLCTVWSTRYSCSVGGMPGWWSAHCNVSLSRTPLPGISPTIRSDATLIKQTTTPALQPVIVVGRTNNQKPLIVMISRRCRNAWPQATCSSTYARTDCFRR